MEPFASKTPVGMSRSKYEYEDLARIAREQDVCIEDVIAAVDK